MNTELIILVAIVVVGYLAFMTYSHYASKSSANEKGKSTLPSPTRPVVSKSQTTKTGLLMKYRENGLDRIQEATLIVMSRIAREDFLGSVDIIEGHHDELPIPQYNVQHAPKSWTFVGDRDKSDPLFEQEVQTIIADLERDGWKLKSGPAKGKLKLWLMSRT